MIQGRVWNDVDDLLLPSNCRDPVLGQGLFNICTSRHYFRFSLAPLFHHVNVHRCAQEGGFRSHSNVSLTKLIDAGTMPTARSFAAVEAVFVGTGDDKCKCQ
jgi:hypothetical protein